MSFVPLFATRKRRRSFPLSLSPDLWLKLDAGAYQERSSVATPASALGDPIGTIQDHSGNGRHAVAPADNARSLLRTYAVPCARPDGTNDRYTITNPPVLDGAFTVYAIVRRAANGIKTIVAGDDGTTFLGVYSDDKVYVIDDAGTFPLVNFTGTLGRTILKWSRPDASTAVTFEATGQAASQVSGTNGTLTLEWLMARTTNGDFGVSDFAELFVKKALISGADKTALDSYFEARRSPNVVGPIDFEFGRTVAQPGAFSTARMSAVGRLSDIATATNTSGTQTLAASAPASPFVNVSAAVTVSTGGSAYVGLFNAGATVYVAAKYDLPNLKIALVAKNGGAEVELGSYTLGGALSAGAVLEMTLCGRCVVAHVDGTFYLARRVEGTVEVRDPAVLATLKWGRRATGASTTFGATACGYFLGLGITDYHMVRDLAGNVVQDGSGYVYFAADAMGFGTGTSADDSLINWANIHNSTWKYNPITGDLVEIGKIFPTYLLGSYTDTPDPIVIPGGAGARPTSSDLCIRQDAGDYEFMNLCPLEGTQAFRMFYGRLASLTGIQTPTVTGLVDMPDGRYNCEFRKEASGTYNVAASNFQSLPELYRGSGLDNLTLADTADDVPDGSIYEGGSQLKVGSKFYSLYTRGGGAIGLSYLHSAGSMVPSGIYSVANPPNNSQVAAWPTIFEYKPGDGTTSFYTLQFDNGTLPQPVVTKDVSLGGGVFLPFVQAGFPVVFKSLLGLNYEQGTGAE